MPTTKRRDPIRRVRASVKNVTREGSKMVERLRADASKIVARSRAEVLKDLRALRSEVVGRADRAVRELERKIVRELHAATQAEMRRLQARVGRLERRVAELTAKPTETVGSTAA